MEDTIEVCSKCGKMPRAIDQASGFFRCTRCGNSELMPVRADDYERIVTELDRNYQEHVASMRRETIEKEMPIEAPKKKVPKVKRKVATKKTARKNAPARKSASTKKAAPKKKARLQASAKKKPAKRKKK